MLRSIILAVAVLLAPTALLAKEPAGSSKPVREAHKLSVAGGIGFLADVNSAGGKSQFLMQFDALYSLTNNIAIGSVFQVGPAGNSSTIALTAEGRFYFPLGDGDGIIGKIAPYAGLGLGFRSYTSDTTDFLFPMILGVEYDLMEHLSLTSDMRFNITSGRDRFYYSWQLVGARFRF
jgi:hypothetical protein